MSRFTYVDSPLGEMLFTSDGEAITGLYFVGQKYQATWQPGWIEDRRHPLFNALSAQLEAYFAGGGAEFAVPMAMNGTSFQRKVWQALWTIPRGRTVSYGRLAASVGTPTSVRAVAAAVGRNPISIVVPCHRVIGSDGSLTGYAGGLQRKRALLQLERDWDNAALTAHASSDYNQGLLPLQFKARL
jgi:methylated-DNA-[protein]-cysteine S-methyltransferase